MKKTLILLSAVMAVVSLAKAQDAHYGESFELSDTLVPNQSHEYTASNYIELQGGFYSSPNTGKQTLLELDSEGYGIHPPEDGLTNGSGCVVGSLGGTVDVSAMGGLLYSIPLELPEGINGMRPSLAITYNSQGGNGLLGWGWDLTGLSMIERTGRTRYHDGTSGAVTMNDTTDRFMLDGNRLIAVANYGDSVEYKTEQDGMSRIMAYYGNTIISHFKVWNTEGKTLEYGCTNNSRLTLQNSGSKALCWLLNRVSDRNGNSVLYSYDTYPNTGEYYISSIDYTEQSENGVATTHPEITVRFLYYSDNRQDYDFRYVAGNIVQSKRLLKNITISQNATNTELEKYSFRYRNSDPDQEYILVQMRERLEKILFEKDGEEINPTLIGWTSNQDTNVMHNVRIFDTAIYNNFPFVGDFNGDGYSDLAVVPHSDSVYTHDVDVSFFMNNPNNPGYFTQNTNLTMHGVDRRLDWLYPVDLNDDGLDDLVACFYDSIAATGEETMFVKIFENTVGTNFIYRDSISLDGARLIVRMGDFLGNGGTQLLMVRKGSYTIQSMLVYYSGATLLKKSSMPVFGNLQDVAVGDFDGDGRTEVLMVGDNGSYVYSIDLLGTYFLYKNCFSTNEINHANEQWNHVFTGDFNGDGKTDVLYSDRNSYNNPRWRIFYSTGVSFTATEHISSLAYDLPEYNLFSNSLRKIMDIMAQPGSYNYLGHSVCVADFDGDGISDVVASNRSSIDIYFHYNPTAGRFQSIFRGGTYNGIHQNDPDYYYINCKSQYFHLGHFMDKENMSFIGLEKKSGIIPVRRWPGVFSLKPSSELNSVSKITDGMGNKTEFAYGYVQQPFQEYSYGVRRMPVPVRVVSSITTYTAPKKMKEERLSYADLCHHRDGHGWLGFRRQVRETFVNNTETVRNVSVQSLETMNSHAMLLPEADTSYVFPDGNAVLSSVTSYQFEKACSNYGTMDPNRLVTCPALTEKTVVRYNPDNPGVILSKTFTNNYYNYNHVNGLYYRVYHCDSTLTGVGGQSSTGFANCEFRTVESTTFYSNNYSTWTVNKPHGQIFVQSRTGKPDVERSRWYEYISSESYLPSRVYDIPSRELTQSPFLLQTDYVYFPNGNLKEKIIKVPYGQQGEKQKAYEYEYGQDNQGRLLTKETVSSGNLSYSTSYAYDGYDRVDTLTGANGLATVYQNDAFGVTSWTTNADGVRSCSARRWTSEHPLAPQDASYYVWERSSNGFLSLTFYHKTGAELRNVTYGIRGEPVFTDRKYDNRGRLSDVSNPYKNGETAKWTVYGYDNLDRLITVTTPDSTCTATVYEGFRTETTVTTPQGLAQESAISVNVMGWTVRSDDASGSSVVYDHYADGLMASAIVNNTAATTVTATYDDARNRATLADPDYGTLTTVYDAYGRLKRSASPRELAAQMATINHYDGLDRLVKTTDGLEDTETVYSYNETGVRKGTLDEILFKRQGGADIQRVSYSYDTLARPVSATEQRPTGTYTTSIEYDEQSRVKRVVYPTGVTVRYGYHHGYMKNVIDNYGHLLWGTNSMDASGQLLEANLGNGAVTRHTYDTLTQRLRSIVTTKNLQNLTYSYDKFGNLASRKDNMKNLEETFTYDDMNRLTGITLKRASGQDLHCAVTYDALGRMTSRQAVTAENGVPQVTTVFSQPVFHNTKVHALSTAQTTESLFPTSSQSIAYTGFDKVSKVKQSNDSLCYTYGYDRQRIRMEECMGNTIHAKDYVGMCEYVTETDLSGTVAKSRTFITGPYGVFAVVEKRNGVETLHYILKDNLGSWTTVTNSVGTVEQQLSYDAWGSRMNPDTWANYTSDDTYAQPMFDRGYTGHEHLSSFGLINMNGRMYDPVVSSFLSADRYVQNPLTAQGFNRYAYCMNNPLRFVDPTGWLSGGGGGYGEHPPGMPYYVNGMLTVNLPEVTIRPQDNPSFSNTYVEYVYTPYCCGGGDDNALGYINKGSSNESKGCGGGGGSHNLDFASIALTTMWGASLTEPSPFGEVISTVTTLAATIYYGEELIAKMKAEIAHLQTRQDGPEGIVYELRAKTDGMYPCLNKTITLVHLEAGEIWKIGETTQGTSRYLDSWYQANNVRMVEVFEGNQIEIKICEKILIYKYYIQYGHLPPGNKIFR